MFAIVFGPSKQESIRFAERYLDDWPHHGFSAKIDLKSFDRIPVITEPRIRELPRPGFKSNYVQLGFPTGCYDSKDDATLDVISVIMWRKITELLREENKDPNKGVYRSPSFTDRTFIHGVIGAWFSTINRDYAFYGRDRVLKAFLRLREDLLPKVLVDDIVESLREQFLGKFRDSSEQVMDLVIDATSNGDPNLNHLHAYPDRLSRVTPRKIRDVANKYFHPRGYACAMLLPA